MDSVMEKFSVFDFFNLLIVGFVFIIGSGLLDYDISIHLNLLNKAINGSKFALILVCALILIVAYVCGIFFQAIGDYIEQHWWKYQKKQTTTFLNEPKVVDNIEKYKIYRRKATEYFKANESVIENDKFTAEQNSCFFAYCFYYAQVRGQNKKSEKLREVQGLSILLSVCFGILFFGGLCLSIKYSSDNINVARELITSVVCGLFAISFYFKYKQDTLKRVRMILAVYSACEDMEKSKAAINS